MISVRKEREEGGKYVLFPGVGFEVRFLHRGERAIVEGAVKKAGERRES